MSVAGSPQDVNVPPQGSVAEQGRGAISPFWSDHVAGLSPYVPGEQPRTPQNWLKLNTNEHPLGPSPKALQAMRDAAQDTLRLYPDDAAHALCQAIAQRYGVGADQVLPGNGSDEVLAHVFHALFLHRGRKLLMPDISYSFYHTYCRLYGVPHTLIPLTDDLRVRVEDYVNATADITTDVGMDAVSGIAKGGALPLASAPAAGIIFANPNAPTGIALTLDEIARIARAHPDSPVVVDEAYVDFGAQSAVALLPDHPNIVVVHTLSKSRALAGLRVGYAMASADIIHGLRRVKDSFNSYPLGRLAQAGALAAIQDEAYFQHATQAVVAERENLTACLQALGFDVLPSLANFVFARHPQHDGAALANALRAQGVLVRHFRHPRIDQYLRITVATAAATQRLIQALRVVL